MCGLDEDLRRFDEREIEIQKLTVAGFGDLDSRQLVRVFCEMASVLCTRPLDSFQTSESTAILGAGPSVSSSPLRSVSGARGSGPCSLRPSLVSDRRRTRT
jgi:hypothetical protein